MQCDASSAAAQPTTGQPPPSIPALARPRTRRPAPFALRPSPFILLALLLLLSACGGDAPGRMAGVVVEPTPAPGATRPAASPTRRGRVTPTPAPPPVGLKQTLTGFNRGVEAVAFAPDGRNIAAAGSDGFVKLWDPATGREVRSFGQGHRGTITSLAFSPDGRSVASGGVDKTVKVWEVASGRESRTLAGHTDAVNAVAFSADGATVASGSSDRSVKLWDAAGGREVRSLGPYEGQVFALAFSPDSKGLATGSQEESVRLWDVTTGQEVRSFGRPVSIFAVAFSPDGKGLVGGGAMEGTLLWQVDTGAEVRSFRGHRDSVRAVAFSADGKNLATGSADKTVKVWDVASGRERRTFDAHTEWVQAVAFSPDGKTLVSGSRDNSLKLWDSENLPPPPTPTPVPTPRPARTPAAAGGGDTVTDETGACQVALPAGFRPLPNADDVWTDGNAALSVGAADTGGQDFVAWSRSLPDRLTSDAQVRGFRQRRVDQRADFYRLDFSIDASPYFPGAASGTVAARPGPGNLVCAIQFIYPQGQEGRYDPITDSIVPTLQATRP